MDWLYALIELLFLHTFLLHSEILRLPCSTFANFTEIHRDSSISSSFKIIYNVDVNTCKFECIRDRKCKSINVSEDDGACELNAKAAEDPKDRIKTHPRYGWTYYSTLYNQTSVGQKCSKDNRCPPGRKCVDTCICPGYRCIKLESCSDWYRNGARSNGIYYIFDHYNKTNKVFCDFEAKRRYIWTLVMSIQFQNNNLVDTIPLTSNFSLNEQNPNWMLYRLSKPNMMRIRNTSTHWRGTCNAGKRQNTTVDSIRVALKELDPPNFIGADKCKKVEYVNIRGIEGYNVSVTFWQMTDIMLHVDSSETRCSFNATKGSVFSEDNFGYYLNFNPKFSCTESRNATTQIWFGEIL